MLEHLIAKHIALAKERDGGMIQQMLTAKAWVMNVTISNYQRESIAHPRFQRPIHRHYPFANPPTDCSTARPRSNHTPR